MNLPNLFQNKPNIFDVSSIKYKKLIDQQLITKLIDYLKVSHKYLSRQGLSKIMVGIHGEIDSLVTSLLLKQALGENIIVMIFDFGTDTSQITSFCNKFALDAYILNRRSAYQAELAACQLHKQSDVLRFYLRFINYHLFIQADKMKAGVVDTLDKSNRLLGIRPEGFYGHIMPFYSLYKSELFSLAKLLQIPPQLYNLSCGYQDFIYPDNTALTWDQIDPILFLLTEKQLTPEDISQEFNIDLQWLKKLKSNIDKTILKTTASQFLI